MRARLQRLAASRRTLPPLEDDERQRALLFWTSLPTDARCEALRFEELSLVQRLHSHMDKLARAEIWAASNGLGDPTGGQRSDGSSYRLNGFGFEVDPERDCLGRQREPTAFAATEEFAAMEDIAEELQHLLGTPLLDGRPILQCRDWYTILDDAPGSWEELQAQVYRLVELVILHTFFEAGSPDEPQAAAETNENAASKESTSTGPSASAKRRLRKKKKNAALMQSREEETRQLMLDAGDCEDAPVLVVPQETNQCLSNPVDHADANVLDTPQAMQKDSQRATEPTMEKGCLEEDVANSSAGSSTDDATKAKNVSTNTNKSTPVRTPSKLKRSMLMPNQPGAPCFAWLPSLLGDGSTEWKWMTFQSKSQGEKEDLANQSKQVGARAFVKNTFLDVEEWMTSPSAERKNKSAMF